MLPDQFAIRLKQAQVAHQRELRRLLELELDETQLHIVLKEIEHSARTAYDVANQAATR